MDRESFNLKNVVFFPISERCRTHIARIALALP